MKGKITLAILRFIAEKGMEAVALCEAIAVAGYGASFSQIQRVYESRVEGEVLAKQSHEIRRYRQNYQKLLSKLKKDGLVTARTDSSGRNIFFVITPRGKLKLSELVMRQAQRLPPIQYKRTKRKNPLIVAFDIPERDSRKRNWLREVLKYLGLKMIQKSVWVGTSELPQVFLDDLRRLNLVDCVEIFEVGKSGTLRHIA